MGFLPFMALYGVMLRCHLMILSFWVKQVVLIALTHRYRVRFSKFNIDLVALTKVLILF